MTYDFTSFLTVFQPYQDDGWVKGCVQWSLIYDCKDPCLKLGWNHGQVDQQASALPTELPGFPAINETGQADSTEKASIHLKCKNIHSSIHYTNFISSTNFVQESHRKALLRYFYNTSPIISAIDKMK